ncbi:MULTISPECIES: amino acid ABC transporter permease [Desulfococcus]|uniref:Polar amino acid ABC transporter, inner membrane subunit n=1 Tax=Desulfococcus multivorans DSM 2059 TaxID=1121405 RepID=S7TYK8_DESML|nr:amino acid ABC transporter permease [Desulfococcus multivorans]AOY57086.1 GlnP3: glutamine ABC transporter, permease protein [Desulfococcus multivorans]AQU99596.1 amino acid ABC transporter permease [Desulfococcus multivorans]EPR41795.1 polar amino acid ABC transporter, inner membrane subunit [Desulfococcus multivorans DSM 2059]MDX9818844.1 amino acid ABC transporter permease [Desulfococcus multivorans]SJZ87870.1 polar amino acid transport system permease protein [Desulfococcus multivorans 
MLSTFNFRVITDYLPLFLQGLRATLWISAMAMSGAFMIGVPACICRLSRVRLLSAPAAAYIDVVRSTPLLVQLYFFYFGLPSLGLRLTEQHIGIMVLSLNSGAYIAEIIRAGILSVHPGQVDASIACGLNLFQRMRYIILPQAIGETIPPLLGQAVVLVKDSALLSLISVFELTRAGQIMASERFMPAEGFFTTAACYLLLYYILKSFSGWWRHRLAAQKAL